MFDLFVLFHINKKSRSNKYEIDERWKEKRHRESWNNLKDKNKFKWGYASIFEAGKILDDDNQHNSQMIIFISSTCRQEP